MDRLGLGDGSNEPIHADPPIANQNAGSTPLAFSAPTEHVELPSGGKYYPPGHALHNSATIEIKYLTAKEEDILTSASLMKKGLTIERLLRSIIVDKTIDPQNLLTGDRNAILVASRKTGYGATYKAQLACPSCLERVLWEINLEELTLSPGGCAQADGFDVIQNEDNSFDVTLPRSKVVVTLGLLTGRDESTLSATLQKRKKHKLEENLLTQQLAIMIKAVNGSSQPQDIQSLVEFLPAFDSRYVRTVYSIIMPNVDMNYDFECPQCAFDATLEVPLTAEFFWPK